MVNKQCHLCLAQSATQSQKFPEAKALTIENLIEFPWRSMDDEVCCYAYLQHISEEVYSMNHKQNTNTNTP